ncbi:hypothetical protein OROHE_004169 [Orobanche hederae]
MPSQEILKIRDGIPLEAEEILTYIKRPSKRLVCYFSSKLYVPSNVVHRKRVARILFFKIRPSQEILKIPDGTPLEAEEILTYLKKSSKRIDLVARIMFFKIRPSQEILKIRDGIPLEAEEILTYIKSPRNGSVYYFSSKLDIPCNVVQKKRVARILFFKIRPSQEILKIRDGTPWSNVVQKKRVARILFFKIRPSQEILKIRDGTPLEKKRVARILFFKIRPSQEILKIRDGIPLEAEEILTYLKSPRNGSVCYFSSKLGIPCNVVQKKRVARILFFKIRPSQEILKIRDGTPWRAEEILTYIKSPRNGSVCYFSSKLDVPSNVVQKKRVARIQFFKIRPSQEILKIRDGTPLEAEEILTYIKRPSKRLAEEILTYIKSPRNGSVCYFSSKLDVPSNVVQKKRVARIQFFKIRPSQEILKIRDGTPLEAEEILTYIKRPSKRLVCYFSSKLYVLSNVVQRKRVARILFFKIRPSQEILKIPDGTPLEKKRVARILFFKIRPSQEILKIRDGIPLEAEEILTYIKSPRNGSVCYFSIKLDIPCNVVQKKRVARILFFKIRPSQEILKIRDGIPLEAEEILTYIKSPRNGSVCYFSSKLDIPCNVVQKKRVARIMFFKIRPSQEILKIRDGIPLEAEEILTYIKSPRNGSVCYFSSKLDIPCNVVQKKRVLDVPSNVVQKKRVARIQFFKIRPSQEILKIRDGIPLEAEEILTYIKALEMDRVARILFFKIRPSQEILKIRDGIPLEAEEILTYIKSPRNGSVCYFSSKLDIPCNVVQKKRVARILKLDVPSNVVQKKRVARILFFKIRPSQEILKIRDGTPLEAEEILTYIKRPSKRLLDVPSNVVQKKRVARIQFFKIRPSQEILKIRDGTPLEAEEILTYIKRPSKRLVCYFSSKLYVLSNVVQRKRVARILFFKIRPSQEILKIPDGTPLEKKRVARILFFKIRPSQEILKIRDGIPLEAEEILTYIKSPRNGSVCYFSIKLDIPCNVVQKKRVARILFFKIRPSQEILKIRDGIPLEAEEILTYIKSPRNGSVCYFSSKLDIPCNVVQKKRVARIMFFKIRPSQEILKIRDGIPLEAEEILTYIKSPRNGSVCYFSSKLDIPCNVVQKKRVLDVPSNVVQKKRVARIQFFKIRPSQEILKIRDGIPLEAEEILTYIKALEMDRVARILFFKIRPSQEILKIRDGIPLEAEEILTYIKSPRNGSVCYFSIKLDIPCNVVQKKRAEEILTYIKSPRNGSVCYFSSKLDVPSNVVQKKRVARIQFFKIRPSQEILKIRDGTPLEAEEILTYIKRPSKRLVCYFSSKLYVLSNVVQRKRVARILFFKIRPSQEILKIPDGTPLEKKRVARILFFKIRPSQEILKIRDGIPLEAEEILTYIKSPRNGSVCYFSIKLDIPCNVVQKKRVARILFFKIRPSQEILKIRDGIPLEAEEILTYIKSPRNGSVCYFSSKLDIPCNVVQKKRVARIMFFKIRPSQEILKIRDGIPLEAEEILTYIKSPRNGSVCYFSSKLDIPCNVVQKKRVARILKLDVPSNVVQKKRVARIQFFKIRPSQEILKIRDGIPLEAEEILTYIKALEMDRVARILFFKIRPSQEILKIRDGIPLEAEEILTYIKSPRNGSVCYFSSKLDIPCNVVQKKRVARILKLDVPSNVVQKKRVARILFFKIRPSQEILKIRDGTPLEAEEILTYIKRPSKRLVCYFSSKLYVLSNVVQRKRVARILFFKIRPSQEILKIPDGTPLEAEEILTYIKKAEEILTYIKSPRNGSVCYFSSKLDVPSNVVQKKRVARIQFFKIRPSQEILKIRDGTPLEAEEILTYIKSPRNGSVCYFSSKLDVPSNVVQKKKVARILLFKIRPSQEILKIRDGTPLEAEEILTYIKKPSKRICLLLF